MVQARKHLDLVLFAAEIVRIRRWCVDELHGDLAPDMFIPRAVNGPHRTVPDLFKEAIPAAEKKAS
jgi:hypothetical protein